MATERKYLIRWDAPGDYSPRELLRMLPSPIGRGNEIYNYSVEKDGFHVIDRGIDDRVTGHALKLFLDEALRYSEEVVIHQIP
jgi:hypothetical protein